MGMKLLGVMCRNSNAKAACDCNGDGKQVRVSQVSRRTEASCADDDGRTRRTASHGWYVLMGVV